MKLTIDIQTRGRPDNVRQVLECLLPNLALDNTTVLVTADDDDRATIDAVDTWPKDPRVLVSIEPREDTRGLKFDRALRLAPADVYMPAADTVFIRRKGFDKAILDASLQFKDGIGCVYTPLVNASFPGFQCLTKRLVELLGYVYPRQFPFWFIDHWLDDVVRMIDRYVVVDIDSEHNSLRNQSRTHGLRDLKFWADFYDANWMTRETEARRVIDAMDETPERKAALPINFLPIHIRSQAINDLVRNIEASIVATRGETEPPTPGYLRAKAAAEAFYQKAAA